MRKKLPNTRCSITHKFVIHAQDGDFKGFISVGLYDDGRPGEAFLTMDGAHPTARGLAHAWAVALSLCLQSQIPLTHLCAKFEHVRFEPSGMTDNPKIPIAKSIVDYVARWLELTFDGCQPSSEGQADNTHEKQQTKG